MGNGDSLRVYINTGLLASYRQQLSLKPDTARKGSVQGAPSRLSHGKIEGTWHQKMCADSYDETESSWRTESSSSRAAESRSTARLYHFLPTPVSGELERELQHITRSPGQNHGNSPGSEGQAPVVGQQQQRRQQQVFLSVGQQHLLLLHQQYPAMYEKELQPQQLPFGSPIQASRGSMQVAAYTTQQVPDVTPSHDAQQEAQVPAAARPHSRQQQQVPNVPGQHDLQPKEQEAGEGKQSDVAAVAVVAVGSSGAVLATVSSPTQPYPTNAHPERAPLDAGNRQLAIPTFHNLPRIRTAMPGPAPHPLPYPSQHAQPDPLPGPSPGPLPGPLPAPLAHALPGQLPDPLPSQLQRLLPGQMPRQMTDTLPSQVQCPLPGQMPRHLPGQMPQALPGQMTDTPLRETLVAERHPPGRNMQQAGQFTPLQASQGHRTAQMMITISQQLAGCMPWDLPLDLFQQLQQVATHCEPQLLTALLQQQCSGRD